MNEEQTKKYYDIILDQPEFDSSSGRMKNPLELTPERIKELREKFKVPRQELFEKLTKIEAKMAPLQQEMVEIEKSDMYKRYIELERELAELHDREYSSVDYVLWFFDDKLLELEDFNNCISLSARVRKILHKNGIYTMEQLHRICETCGVYYSNGPIKSSDAKRANIKGLGVVGLEEIRRALTSHKINRCFQRAH